MSQLRLFAWEHFTEQDVRTALDPIHPILWRAIMEPWRQLEQYRLQDPNFRHLTPTGMTWWLHEQIVAWVQRDFPQVQDAGEDEGGWYIDGNGMFHLAFKFTELTFKKLDDCFQRRNYPTQGNREYWTQRLLPCMPLSIRLVIGYQWTDATASAIRRIAVVCPAERGARWWYEIPAPVQAVSIPVLVPPPDDAGEADERGRGFRVKSRKKAGGQAAES